MKIGYYRNKADRLFQEKIRKLYDSCFVCGEKHICGHHFITKASSANLRYDEKNIVPLCLKCHCLIHSQPALITAIIVSKKGNEWVEYLKKNKLNQKLRTNKAYYLKIIEGLKYEVDRP